jgi:putative transposase
MALQAVTRYPSDLSHKEWKILEPHVPKAKPGGRPYAHAMREIINGMLYVKKTGCPWRFLPKDFPPWQTVYYYFRLWSLDGTLEELHAVLRGELRKKLGRHEYPSACILDSQSVKTGKKGD